MSIVRLVVGLALAVLGVLALSGSASAEHEESVTNHEEPLEVTDERTRIHCPAVSSLPADEVGDKGYAATGGCPVVFHGEFALDGHLFGFESVISDCVVEWEMIVGEEGEGWVQEAILTDHAGLDDCAVEPCTIDGETMEAWPVHIREDTGSTGTQEWRALEWCVADFDGGNERRCEVELPLTEDPLDPHHYEAITPAGGSPGQNHEGAPNCELEGRGEFESGQIELEHDHPIP